MIHSWEGALQGTGAVDSLPHRWAEPCRALLTEPKAYVLEHKTANCMAT